MNFDNVNNVMTTSEVRVFLRLGKSKTYELLRTGELKSIRMGDRYYVLKPDLSEFLVRNRYTVTDDGKSDSDEVPTDFKRESS